MKTSGSYRILSGTFRDSLGQVRGPGDAIDLDDDVARREAARVTPTTPDASMSVQTPAMAQPAADPDAA